MARPSLPAILAVAIISAGLYQKIAGWTVLAGSNVYNTGINTYIWLVSKARHRAKMRLRLQLVMAPATYQKK